jgi:predicted esterase
MACDAFAGLSISAGVTPLETNGAKVTSAAAQLAAGTGAKAVGAFCRIMVEIAPVDPKAPPIKVEVNFPETWNGKALMYGGGGFNGLILSTGGTIRLQPPEVPIPLARGFVTFGGDSGHEGANRGDFALNEEALKNYAFDAVKKTRDVAVYLIKLHYGRPHDKLYFHGSSNGGKEALGFIQRYPEDLDGAMIFWPATYFGTANLQFGRVARAFSAPGAYMSMSQRKVVLDAAMEACDALDGIRDGVISNARACQQTFDPAKATVNGRPLHCSDGAIDRESCLSDAQIGALRVMGSPLKLDSPLASGEKGYPGFYVWGLDLGSRETDELAKSVLAQGLGKVAPAYPAAPGMPFIHAFADQYARFFVMRNPQGSWETIDPEKPGEWRARLSMLAGQLDMPRTDLSAFQKRGGKILLVHGLADQIVPPQSSVDYYERLVAAMGRENVSQFLRFYEVPGTAHSGFGVSFNPAWDVLGALDAWAAGGAAPTAPVVTDTHFKPGRARPLCEYPSYPRYQGGDPDQATSFTCER